MCARRADGERVHDKELIKPPCPLRAQRFDGMKHTPRVVIPPHRNVGIALCEGRKNPLKASRRNILFLCCRWQIPPRILLFPIGAEISFYGSFYHLRRRWPASHLSGLRRSRCPAKCTGRGMAPHPQAADRSPHPLKAASVSAETLLPASGGAASKGDQSPFEEPPALRGDERNHFRKVTDYEKRYQIQHAHGVR